MKKYFLCLVSLIIFMSQCQFGFASNTREKAPSLEVLSGSSKEIYRLIDFKGKVIFVNFWATWCQSCQEEMPFIQGLYNRFRNDTLLQIVSIIYRDDYQKALEYRNQHNYDYPFFLDSNNKTAISYGVTGVPETYIIDKKGFVRKKVIGPFNWSSKESISLISGLVNETTEVTVMAPSPQTGYRDDQPFRACGIACGSFIFIIIAIFILNIALLVWVAKDAKNRGMGSPVGWIFLILFTGVIGLIIYLFSRPKGELVICDVCKNKKFRVQKICPHCGNSSSPMDVKADKYDKPKTQIGSGTGPLHKFCTQCGSKNEANSKFCIDCGEKLE